MSPDETGLSWTYTSHSLAVMYVCRGWHYRTEELLQLTVPVKRMRIECMRPLDAHCRADNGSDTKKNSLLPSLTSHEDLSVQPRGVHKEFNFYHAFHSRNWARNQSQLRIFCSPIPALQNGIGFMLLRWGHKKCPDVNHTPVR